MSVPSATVMAHVAKLAIEHDKPIYLDYFSDSLSKACCIGVTNENKCLVKSDTEYTSPIESIMRLKEEKMYIIMTENSIYVVSADIPVKRIVQPSTDTSSA
jgi:hypothetical protein